MAERVFIMGATPKPDRGKVARELVHQIFSKNDTNELVHRNPTIVIGLASSERLLFNPQGLSHRDCIDFTTVPQVGYRYEGQLELKGLLREYDLKTRLVDATSDPNMLEIHRYALTNTPHSIVTANKLPLVNCSYGEFRDLVREPMRYKYGCSVMAGAEAVEQVGMINDLGEVAAEISGCFSGTLGFITTELEQGRAFSESVMLAYSKGYTEAHPAVDLSGEDVRSKILIVARTAYANASLCNVVLEPFAPLRFIPNPNPDVKEYLEELKGADPEMRERFEGARGLGKKLRYVASASLGGSKPVITVGFQMLDPDHPLAQLTGTTNKITITSGPYGTNGKKPYSIEAPGAGVDVTARNIRADLIRQIERRHQV